MKGEVSIPKRIHYCWFGGNRKPDLVEHCVTSWRQYCPDYSIVEWSEASFDVASTPLTAAAYASKKYAFVSDFIRAKALHDQGGIYLDADVELRRPLDEFLHHRAFTGFEKPGLPFTAVWGSTAGHSLAAGVLAYYAGRAPEELMRYPNTRFISELIASKFGADRWRDELQECDDGLVIYPSTHFCLDLPINYAVHHFLKSWGGGTAKGTYGQSVKRQFHARMLAPLLNIPPEYLVKAMKKHDSAGWHFRQAVEITARRAGRVLKRYFFDTGGIAQ